MQFGDWGASISTCPANSFKCNEGWTTEIPSLKNGNMFKMLKPDPLQTGLEVQEMSPLSFLNHKHGVRGTILPSHMIGQCLPDEPNESSP